MGKGRWSAWGRGSRDHSAAEQAHQTSQEALDQAKKQRPEVQAISDSLRQLRDENHFAKRIEALIRGEGT